MSTDRDTTRIVRSWLRSDEQDSADRVLGTVLDRLETTPQRRATRWPAWRTPPMTTATRLALGGLAIVVVGLIGVSLFGQNVGNPPPTPIPSPTMAAAISLPAFGDLDAGTYRIRNPGWTALPFTVTVPDGWTTTEGWLTKGDTEDPTGRTVFLNSWIVSHVFSDGCMRGSDEDLLVETPTAEDIVATLAEQGGHETTGPTATSLGGRPAHLLVFTIPEASDTAACDGDSLRLWPGPGPDLSSGQLALPGMTASIFVLDLNGDPMIVVAGSQSDSAAADIAELETVVDSIEFEGAAAP
jgi:hypothetical protein